jgi:hypothetical protein
MSSKKEYRRTVKRLKERVEKMPARVMVRPKRLKKVAKSIEEAKEILKRGRLDLKGAREPISNEEFEKKAKAGKVESREYGVDMVPVIGDPPKELEMTNGVELPVGLVGMIKDVRDVKVAKAIAKAANRWFGKLKVLEEIRFCRQFTIDDEVWWTKKGQVMTGRVARVRTRKLTVRIGPAGEEYAVVLAKKVKKGQVPKEYLMPDPKRWRIGRAKGGERQSAGAVVSS